MACLAPLLSRESMLGPALVALFAAIALAGFWSGLVTASVLAVAGIGLFIATRPEVPQGAAELHWWVQSAETIIDVGCLALLASAQVLLVEALVAARRALAAERAHQEARLSAERAALTEVQHRNANALQFVASLLSLQAERVAWAEAADALADGSERLRTMAGLHRRLHDPAMTEDGFAALVKDVAEGLLAARGYVVGPGGIALDVTMSDLLRLGGPAGLNAAVLIIAEAVTNAAKHGFVGRDTGRLRISIGPSGDALVLAVEDDGVGLRPDLPEDSLGLVVMQAMAGRLGGDFALAASEAGGARVTVTIPSDQAPSMPHRTA